jgi:FG-GAP repeat
LYDDLTRPVTAARELSSPSRVLLAATLTLVVVAAVPRASAGRQPMSVIRIQGATAGSNAGVSVAGAGDVNGDGRPDLLVGAHFAGNRGRARAGSVYVVFGRTGLRTIDLAVIGESGFRIDGAAAGDLAGWSVAGAGDVNGDGRGDVLVGAPEAGNDAGADSGSAFVVFGRNGAGTVDLAALGKDGFRIVGASSDDDAGTSVAGAGDVNGDGQADVLVGARFAGNNGRAFSGSAYVVFGRAASGAVDLAALGNAGFRIDGAAASDLAGWSVARAGDVNGDGRGDLLVGARFAGNNARAASGAAYVVFGRARPMTVDLAALGDGGFRIDGAAAGDLAGGSVAGVGDLNDDGRADVVVGARGADNNDRPGSGSAYVVFGKSTRTRVDLANLGSNGFRIDGAAVGDRAGYSVAGPGDVNGDGRPDVLVGAHYADAEDREDAGTTYVVFGTAKVKNVDLAGLRQAGFRVYGAVAGDGVGWSVAGAGDVNGDGRVDVLVGAPDADDNARNASGSAYLVYGRQSPRTVHLDATAPTLTLVAPSPQRALGRKAIVVRASCNEACSLSASGTIAVGAQGTTLPLRPAARRLARAGRLTLRLGLSRSVARRLARVERGTRVTARVTVRVRDRAGNAVAATRTTAVSVSR